VYEVCESAVYLLKGSERILVMEGAARILTAGNDIICVDPLGDRTRIPGARNADANLMGHEIIIKSL